MPHKATARYKAGIDGAGRALIPVGIRKRLGMKPGDMVTITEGPSGRILLKPALAALREAQNYFRNIAPASVLWSRDPLQGEQREMSRR
jgi:AbrB family looped-hinge helix DNA binding protein